MPPLINLTINNSNFNQFQQIHIHSTSWKLSLISYSNSTIIGQSGYLVDLVPIALAPNHADQAGSTAGEATQWGLQE